MFPWILCCILLIVVFFLITKIIFIEKSIDEMRKNIAGRLGITISQVNGLHPTNKQRQIPLSALWAKAYLRIPPEPGH